MAEEPTDNTTTTGNTTQQGLLQLDAASLAAIIDGVAKKLQERPPEGRDPPSITEAGEHSGATGKYLGRTPLMLHPMGVILT